MTYAEELGYDYTESLLLQVAGSIAFSVAVPLMARLSDRVGRKPVVILGTLAYGAFFFACFPTVNGHVLALATVAYVLVNVLMAAPPGLHPRLPRRAVPRQHPLLVDLRHVPDRCGARRRHGSHRRDGPAPGLRRRPDRCRPPLRRGRGRPGPVRLGPAGDLQGPDGRARFGDDG
ncbi:MFS transporter [Streptomyces sp. NPDC056696]|uniref:MFS transporter n=1 Tax=unclassified Streptomyces TaxID=2593676 RepID=UPI003675A52D